MGLPLALKAHNDGNLELAVLHYKRATTQDSNNPILYQNYGSVLKTLGHFDTSEKVYLQGVSLFPDHAGINLNLANLYREIKPVSSLQKYNLVLHLYISQGESIDSNKVMSVITDIVSVCREIGLIHLFLV